MMYDGLYCAVRPVRDGLRAPSGTTASAGSRRERQDAFSARRTSGPPRRIKDGRFADEIVAVEVPQRKGDPIVVDTDEGVRPGTTAESLAALRPAFDKDGTITGRQRHPRSPTAARPSWSCPRSARGSARGHTSSARSSPTGRSPGPDASLLLPARQRDQQGARQGRARPSWTSTSSRSTRRSPPSASHRWTTSASTRHQRERRRDRPRAPGRDVGTRLALTLLDELAARRRHRRRRPSAAAAARATLSSCALRA